MVASDRCSPPRSGAARRRPPSAGRHPDCAPGRPRRLWPDGQPAGPDAGRLPGARRRSREARAADRAHRVRRRRLRRHHAQADGDRARCDGPRPGGADAPVHLHLPQPGELRAPPSDRRRLRRRRTRPTRRPSSRSRHRRSSWQVPVRGRQSSRPRSARPSRRRPGPATDPGRGGPERSGSVQGRLM